VANIKQGLSWRNKPIGQKIDALMQAGECIAAFNEFQTITKC